MLGTVQIGAVALLEFALKALLVIPLLKVALEWASQKFAALAPAAALANAI
jgi:hypothetical protein